MEFGKLRLSAQGTNNGSGFDIFYDFKESHGFAEFGSKKEFYFIQPWMQFPNQKYSDTCKLVSIELVERFNRYPELVKEHKNLLAYVERLRLENNMMISELTETQRSYLAWRLDAAKVKNL